MPTTLHLLSASGGGTERFVRDAVAVGGRHLLLHVGPSASILESDQPERFLPLKHAFDDPRFLAGLLASFAIDQLHCHWLSPASLPWLTGLHALGLPYLISLHDLGFLRTTLFEAEATTVATEPHWITQLTPIMAAAQGISVPSGFLQHAFASVFSQVSHIIEPGVAIPTAATEPSTRAARPTIGMVGAFGAHKGAALLEAVWAHPAAVAADWVLIGYTAERLYPQQIAPHVRLLGPFLASDTAALLRANQVDLVWFPNQLPESFSYTLSDTLAAGVPVAVPDRGALAARVHAHGGGVVLSQDHDVGPLIAELLAIAQDVRERGDTLPYPPASHIPTLHAMQSAMSALYQTMTNHDHKSDTPWTSAERQAFSAAQVGELTFRHENIRLAREYGQVRDWANKLEADVAILQHSLQRAQHDYAALLADRDHLATDIESLRQSMESALASMRADAVQQAQLQSQQIAQLHDQLSTERAQNIALSSQCADAQTQIAGLSDQLRQASAALQQADAERHSLGIKAHRYDRLTGWVPSPVKALLRRLRAR